MDNQILAHTKYNCTYHIVFIPKYRREAMYGKLGKEVGEILSTICKITGIQLIKGGVCPNHVHLYVSIPPKMSISGVMSKLKGKSTLIIFDRHPEYRDKYGIHFWARILCGNNWASERRYNQEIYRESGGMQQDRRASGLF